MDRIDMHVEVDNVSYGDLISEETAEPSVVVKERIDKAREVQNERYSDTQIHNNAQMTVQQTKKHCKLDKDGERLMQNAFEKLQLSARARDRILKVARTIADLEGSENILSKHVAEAIQYRSLDRKYRM